MTELKDNTKFDSQVRAALHLRDRVKGLQAFWLFSAIFVVLVGGLVFAATDFNGIVLGVFGLLLGFITAGVAVPYTVAYKQADSFRKTHAEAYDAAVKNRHYDSVRALDDAEYIEPETLQRPAPPIYFGN